MPEALRTGVGFPVFGSNGVVGRHSRYLIEGSGIVVGRKGSVGRVCWSPEPFWPIDTAYYVVPKDGASLRWIYWLLSLINLKRLDAATGVPGLNRNDVYEVQAPLPDPPDQSRISAVLDTVDDAIAKTEAVIAKLKQVRAGLLNDLLTRGLDDHGQLRDPIAHPEQFQNAPLGRIPREWTVTRLGDVARIRRGASPRPIDDPHWFTDVGPGWVRIADVTRSSHRLLATEQRLSPSGVERSVNVYPEQVLMSIAATVGLAIVCGMEACIHDGFVVFDQHEGGVTPNFLAMLLNHNRQRIALAGQTGTQANINTAIVEQIVVALPGIPEQERILAAIGSVNNDIDAESGVFGKLNALKSGLMTDLLTGRVRVPDSLFATEGAP
ncbi:MAG: restriction endonuclease subunit S [Candidatus Omnitrophota bacterium]|nr:restriction endonuclease subunit S [Candidatus Omnitrophota bacterium]